ncbi:uncharacterized protein F4822DRAFT_442803 [Hypoxylon trugodes]|uniref:uncharacterized protein n=1 Tax=Hypoxylon trugodes TaxID=326681 RepID=UPI00219D4D71|nr:uncharacterized protein F4822DRAFT_442803 [Hypoxylon trugodes]KAI1389574.1 hypothetical protein F4822DRAFT_442803 [Hypoxylon trugodes]
MKFAALLIAAVATPGALADFWISYVNQEIERNQGKRIVEGGYITNGPPSTCDDLTSYHVWPNSGDVSADKTGMRTVPVNPVDPPLYRDPLDITEINTGDAGPGHFTVYKDRGGAMVDLNGKLLGTCGEDRSKTFDTTCDIDRYPARIQGSSMYFCTTGLQAGSKD